MSQEVAEELESVLASRRKPLITDSKVKFIVLVISRTRFLQGVQVVYMPPPIRTRLLMGILHAPLLYALVPIHPSEINTYMVGELALTPVSDKPRIHLHGLLYTEDP